MGIFLTGYLKRPQLTLTGCLLPLNPVTHAFKGFLWKLLLSFPGYLCNMQRKMSLGT